MEFMIAGIAGAIVAVIFIYLHAGLTSRTESRSTLAMDVISWADDIYDRLITIHAQRDATFTGQIFGLSNDEYRTIVKEVKSMLLASKMRAKVALVYGKGIHLHKFDTLREEFMGVTEDLLGAVDATWKETNERINRKFADVIEPLMKSAETLFVQSSRPLSFAATFTRTAAPTLYLPVQNKDIAMQQIPAAGTGPIERFISWQSVKIAETFLTVVRVVMVLAACLFACWLFVGMPDLAPYLTLIKQGSAGSVEKPLELGIQSPRDYGIAAEGDTAPLPADGTITAQTTELPIKLTLKNAGAAPAFAPFLVLNIPADLLPVRDTAWKNAWRETPGPTGKTFIFTVGDDLKPDETKKLDPSIEFVFPKDGDYHLSYTIFSANKAPRTGTFTVRIVKKQ